MPTHRFYIGAMSGTSVDGLDIALTSELTEHSIDAPKITLIDGATYDFPEPLRNALLNATRAEQLSIAALARLDIQLGTFIGQTVRRFLDERGHGNLHIEAVGSHGQTIRHHPPSTAEADAETSANLESEAFNTHALPVTWQIGDGAYIAEAAGLTAVTNFRRRDMAAGGQGAPLVPAFHHAVLGNSNETRVVLNLGGIANITVLPAEHATDQSGLLGFDTGPANTLMDAWFRAHGPDPGDALFDQDGRWAASGEVDEVLLGQLLEDPWFALPPPKSTGPEHFNLRWLENRVEQTASISNRHSAADVQATLLALTVRSVNQAVTQAAPTCKELIVCGGGMRNTRLIQALRSEFTDANKNASVRSINELGYDGDLLEAMAFAWLAARTLCNEAGNAPSVTGASGPRVLGAIYPA